MYWVYAGIGLLLVFAAVSDQVARRRGHHLRASRETYEMVRDARKQTRRRLTGRMFPGLRSPDPAEFRKPGSRRPPE